MRSSPQVGLDIGTAGVLAAEVQGRGARRVVRKIAAVDLPQGAVDHGDVRDPDALVTALRHLWRRGRFAHRRVRVGVAHRQAQVREVTVPALRRGDVRSALALHVAAEFPGGTDGLLLDLIPTERVEDAGQPCWRGLLVAAPEAGVGLVLDLVERAGLEPVAADLSALAVARAFADSLGTAPGAVALVDVGAAGTHVVVLRGGQARLIRLVALGVADASQESVAALVDGIVSTLDYHRRSDPHFPVTQVVLTGGGASLDGLGQYVASVLGLPVSVGDPLAAAPRSSRLSASARALAPRAAVALGLATDLAA